MSDSKDTNLSWGGRFSEPTDEFVARFTASVDFDQRMAMQDIQGSMAHAAMLSSVGVLSEDELQSIKTGLTEIVTDIENGTFQWSLALEDV
ncbi:MAG: argininosuccinate lyase, partial [Gammaproteobacteria bacterium]